MAQRFTPGVQPANAARVTMVSRAPLYFASLFIGSDSVELHTTAVAAGTQMAKFSIGTRLAAVQGGVANALLSRILGTSISLSAMDYDALLGAKVDVFQFSRALAAQLELKGATYNELATASMTAGDVYAALSALGHDGKLNGGQQAADALRRLAERTASNSPSLPLDKLIGFGPYGDQPVDEGAGASAQLGLLDLVTMAAAVANGKRQIQLDLGASVPGLTRVVLTLQIGERMATSPWVTLGGKDVVVRTAQTRLYLEAQVGGSNALAGVAVAVPIYLELASGEARLHDMTCGNSTADASVTLAVLPTLAEAWLGQIDKSALGDFSVRPTVSRAALVNVPLLMKVTGARHVRSGSVSTQMVAFTYDDIQALTVKSVSSGNHAGSLIGSLLGDIDIHVSALGLGVNAPTVSSALRSTLSTAVKPLDAILDAVLALVGVRPGQADVVVNGIRCDGAILAQ